MAIKRPKAESLELLFDDVAPAQDRVEGFLYLADFLGADEHAALLAEVRAVPFSPFTYRGFTAKRRVASFGYHYSFETFRVTPGPPMPEFLLPLRARVAGLLACEPAEVVEALVTEYPPGTEIGWHKDVAPFDRIAGVSLAGPCTMRLRRGAARERTIVSVPLAPRSAYVLAGAARREWEHHIPATPGQRYSITFRTLTEKWKARLRRV